MRRRAFLPLLAAPALVGQGEDRNGAALDLMYAAIEKLTAKAGREEVESATSLLRAAIDQQSGLGDAHYFLALCYEKLKDARRAQLARGKARDFGSQALAEELNPFSLAAPLKGVQKLPPLGQKWALAIGINEFVHPRINPLNFAAKDATDFAKVLLDSKIGRFPSANVKVLLNQQATTRQIKSELNWLARSARPEDLAVLFLSSHGSGRESDVVGGLTYVITHDTETDATGDRLFATALPMVEISDIVRTRVKARRTVVILDTCHSAGAMPRVRPSALSAAGLDRISEGEGRVILSACTVEQSSWENAGIGNGYFTSCLLQALRQTGGCRPLTALFPAIREQVRTEVAAIGQQQTPVINGSENADQVILGASSAGGCA
ncbi:MAG: caspase domain-containing protein [Bryobacteraceae bacterium]